jgi:hypothetical protein
MHRGVSSAALAFVLAAACDGDPKAGESAQPVRLAREALLDPQTCQGCHPRHYREWASSMHAYAADDPVFRAMNARAQRETNGELGAFCVTCHAPMAVYEKKTTDGLNVAELPRALRGVTCYACHNAEAIEGDHNGKLRIAGDDVMRGGIQAPMDPGVHGARYSALHDRNSPESSQLCGGCHDVVNQNGVHVERTYLEYQESLLGQLDSPAFDTCQGCHMDARTGVTAVLPDRALPERTLHEHLWPGVDVALTEFPDRALQRAAVECALANGTRVSSLSATPLGEFTITVETNAGHAQPSGAAHDRRLWLELVAYDENDAIVFESGRGDPHPLRDEAGQARDPQLWLMREELFGAAGEPVTMLWEAAFSALHPEGHESTALPALQMPGEPHTLTRKFQLPGLPARLTAQLRMQPIGTDVLEDLVASGDLDPQIVKEMPTFTLHGTAIEWRREDGFTPLTSPKPSPLSCPDDYLCLLDPSADVCARN